MLLSQRRRGSPSPNSPFSHAKIKTHGYYVPFLKSQVRLRKTGTWENKVYFCLVFNFSVVNSANSSSSGATVERKSHHNQEMIFSYKWSLPRTFIARLTSCRALCDCRSCYHTLLFAPMKTFYWAKKSLETLTGRYLGPLLPLLVTFSGARDVSIAPSSSHESAYLEWDGFNLQMAFTQVDTAPRLTWFPQSFS